jgi:hypothetical protein
LETYDTAEIRTAWPLVSSLSNESNHPLSVTAGYPASIHQLGERRAPRYSD